MKEGKKWKASFAFEYDSSSRVKEFDLKVNFFQGVCEGTYTDMFDGEHTEDGAVKIVQQCQPDLKLTLKYKDDTSRPKEEFDVKVDFEKMEIFTVHDESVHFYSIEHIDNAQLTYFIKETDAIFLRHDGNAYIQGKMTALEEEDITGNGDGYVETEVSLYNISEPKKKKAAGKAKSRKSMEPSRQVVKFLINQTFLQSQEKEDQLW